MWYAGSSNFGTSGNKHSVSQVAFATSPDGVSWTGYRGGEPIFNMQGQKVFADCKGYRPGGPCGGNGYLIVKKFASAYYMWFAPLGDAIGLATAAHPEGPWIASEANPILVSTHTQCPHPTTDDLYPFEVYQDTPGSEYRMIMGCADRHNRVPCPGGWTSHPVTPYYLTAKEPGATRWAFDLAHSPLLNRSTPESFDYCSYASIRVMESYAGVGTSVH